MSQDTEKRHPIRVVARRTGLSRDVLRAWELRYDAVKPWRSDGGQRLYSDRDIERLRLLRQAIEAGRRIGQVAKLDMRELEALVQEDERANYGASRQGDEELRRDHPTRLLTNCLEAVRNLDHEELDAALSRAALTLEASELLDHVLSPGQERLATGVVRRTLDDIRISLQNPNGPAVVVATPSGQHHEIGAMLAAAAAAAEGWRVVYLGPDLPAASIAAAAMKTGARAVALSLIYPPDDPNVVRELKALRQMLPESVTIVLGGQSAPSYRTELDGIGALWLPDAPSLRSALDLIRASRRNGNRAAAR
jgi:DNA-binding transcriptional MerR regulator